MAAIVGIVRIVELRWHLHSALGGRHERRVGVIGSRQRFAVGGGLHVIARKAGVDRRAVHAPAALIRIVADAAIGARTALAILAHVGGVVGANCTIHSRRRICVLGKSVSERVETRGGSII